MGFDVNRRTLLTGAGALTALAAVRTAAGAPPLAAVAAVPKLAVGLKLGACTLERILPVERDALPFELKDPAGRLFIVEAHVHDPAHPGIARAGSLDVFLVNGGNGDTPTDETHGVAAMELARVLSLREQAGAEVPTLATIAERWSYDPPPGRR